jgi:hypothetical protein
MKSTFPCWRGWLTAAILGAVLVGFGSGCTPTGPATKAPSTNDGGGEQLPTPPKRDPG